MATYPTSPRSDFLLWCQAHLAVFTANAEEIGLTAAQATAFATQISKATTAETAQSIAQQAAKTATMEVNDEYAALRSQAGDIVRSIRAYAELQSNPNSVYSLAQIPAPADPTPAPPPAQPTNLTVTLAPMSGDLTLQWKASNPAGTSGTSYIIRRRLPGETDFSFVGVTGTKKFVDNTLIAGPDSVQYTVQGQRADSAGPLSQVFTVTFGQLPGGGMTARVSAAAMNAVTSDQAVVEAIANSRPFANGRNGATRTRA